MDDVPEAGSQTDDIEARLIAFLDADTTRDLPHFGQLRQDLVALFLADFRRDGYFVEFGATNGVKLSNSYLLERDHGWRGIVAEPAVDWHRKLRKARSCIIDTRCVWRTSGETLTFHVARAKTLSTIAEFSDGDQHAGKRREHRAIEVETVTLNDLLAEHGAPAHVDYLSVDTEGSEFEILSAFDFSRHSFGFLSVEHNFTAQRAAIHALLERNGYRRILADVSQFDDWYVPLEAPGRG